MKAKLYLLSTLLVVLVSGCSNSTYKPEARLTLSTNQITLQDNQPSALIDADIVKFDKKGISTAFDVVFAPSNAEYISVQTDGNAPLGKSTTRVLVSENSKDTVQFKVQGKKVKGQPTSSWTLDVILMYNNTQIDKKTLSVTVK